VLQYHFVTHRRNNHYAYLVNFTTSFSAFYQNIWCLFVLGTPRILYYHGLVKLLKGKDHVGVLNRTLNPCCSMYKIMSGVVFSPTSLLGRRRPVNSPAARDRVSAQCPPSGSLLEPNSRPQKFAILNRVRLIRFPGVSITQRPGDTYH